MDTAFGSVRARLSWAWVFVMLNMVLADILSFMYPGFLEEVMAGRAGGVMITPGFLLIAALVTEVPLAMVMLNQVLPQRAARWANLVVAPLTIAYVTVGGSTAPHYVLVATMEAIGCIFVAWTAWRWGRAANVSPWYERREAWTRGRSTA